MESPPDRQGIRDGRSRTVADGYTRIEMGIAAVRDEDVKAVEEAFIEIRDRYSRGGSSFGTSPTPDQVFIREEQDRG